MLYYIYIKEVNGMPAIFTHIQFGKEVLPRLPEALQAVVKAHPAPFYLGTQGPDILFYHKPSKKKSKNPARKKGWDLHAIPPADFFQNAANILLKDEENRDEEGKFAPLKAEAAYVLGFLCHFTLDKTCHPTIDEHSVNGLSHGKIESELDKYQFRKIGNPDRGFNAATLFSPSEEAEIAAAKVLDVSRENMRVAMRSMRKINRLFSHKCEFLHRFCHFALTLAGMNGSFGDMFIHKKDDARCETLLPRLNDEFNEAIEAASQEIPAFFANLENAAKKDFYQYDYSGIYHDKEKN